MPAADPRIRILRSRASHALGAMFRRRLGNEVLVFVYDRPAQRVFHTFFCPLMRILALTDEGEPLFDVVCKKNRLVHLPLTRLVVECAPELRITESDLRSIAAFAEFI